MTAFAATLPARLIAPGLIASGAVAIAAVLLEAPLAGVLSDAAGSPFAIPAMVLALLIGMLFHSLAARPVFQPGMTFCVKKLLRVAVGLLGVRVALSDIWALGLGTAGIVIASMALTLVSGVLIARLVGRDDAYGALAGSATAVCGASAALATASVLPDSRHKETDTVFVVVAVNALSTLAMVLYPPICALLGFDDRVTGIMLGATIHDVAQVVGSGYAVSDEAGNSAVVVKLFRVFLLLPVVLAVGWYFTQRGAAHGDAKVPVPVFALVFLALVIVNSLGLIPSPLRDLLSEISRWGLLIAIGALGLGTSLKAILNIGWRHVAVVTGTTLVILVAATAGLMLIA